MDFTEAHALAAETPLPGELAAKIGARIDTFVHAVLSNSSVSRDTNVCNRIHAQKESLKRDVAKILEGR